MKVLHFNEYYGTLGGAEQYLAEICGALPGHDWEAVVAISSVAPTPAVAPPLRVHRLEPSFGLRSARRAPLQQLLDTERPDVVHLHNVQSLLGPGLLRTLRSRAPVVMTAHDARIICPRWFTKIIPSATSPCPHPMGSHCFRHGCYPFEHTPSGARGNLRKFLLSRWQLSSLRKLDRVLVSSAWIHDQLRLNGFPAERLERLPLFVRAALPRPERNTTERRIVYAGRVDEAKGIRPFLDCLARLSETSWTAQVAGTGPFLGEATAIAKRLGLMGRIEFLKHVSRDALAQVLGAARVVVMPSLMPESFGLTGLEAMACGTPVVAFDSGGIADWLENGQTGFLVPWGDVETLAARVRQLLEDDALAESLGRQGQQRARQFDMQRHMTRLCGIYAQVAAMHVRNVAR